MWCASCRVCGVRACGVSCAGSVWCEGVCGVRECVV